MQLMREATNVRAQALHMMASFAHLPCGGRIEPGEVSTTEKKGEEAESLAYVVMQFSSDSLTLFFLRNEQVPGEAPQLLLRTVEFPCGYVDLTLEFVLLPAHDSLCLATNGDVPRDEQKQAVSIGDQSLRLDEQNPVEGSRLVFQSDAASDVSVEQIVETVDTPL